MGWRICVVVCVQSGLPDDGIVLANHSAAFLRDHQITAFRQMTVWMTVWMTVADPF
jgi:hypothetical protein